MRRGFTGVSARMTGCFLRDDRGDKAGSSNGTTGRGLLVLFFGDLACTFVLCGAESLGGLGEPTLFRMTPPLRICSAVGSVHSFLPVSSCHQHTAFPLPVTFHQPAPNCSYPNGALGGIGRAVHEDAADHPQPHIPTLR